MDVPEQSGLHEKGRKVNMGGALEDFRVDVVVAHYVHGALIGQVRAVFAVVHADGGAGRGFALLDETGLNALGFEGSADEVTERIAAHEAYEADFAAQGGGIGGEDGGGGSQGDDHVLGELFLADFRLGFDVVENDIYVEFADRGDVVLFHLVFVLWCEYAKTWAFFIIIVCFF